MQSFFLVNGKKKDNIIPLMSSDDAAKMNKTAFVGRQILRGYKKWHFFDEVPLYLFH
jgi:hypothetical protein